MTQEQFNDIKDKLRVCREERGLNKEDQKRNFRVDYTKELAKFFEAERDNNQYEMIKALCNMIVVAINAGAIRNTLCFKISNNFFSFGLENSINTIFCTFDILGYDPYKCLLETIKELNSRTGSWNEEEGKWVEDLGAYTEEEAWIKAKRIESKCVLVCRPNEMLGVPEDTWVFEGRDLIEIKKWYKADYASCKLESVK
ncbi:hypothetical protein CQA57_05675 [Helicobacter anseris]|uniref:Uncharacterized protein n=1 Tax=Helicobacter anseris TaxID=375926 RepID=A0A3D8J809_9HELI|nr:hypothetical protein [Helicobacter anseris]RDU73014.1 hypothetical protein CQA57_05675 [Helicobacter anseris]